MARNKKTAAEEIAAVNEKLSADAEAFRWLWRNKKTSRLNRVRNPRYCGKITVRDLAAVAFTDAVNFPKGLDTPLCVGDFEGNFCTNVLSVTMGWDGNDHLCVSCDPHGRME